MSADRACPRCARPLSLYDAPYRVTLLPEWLSFGYPRPDDPESGRWDNEMVSAWTLAEARGFAAAFGFFATIWRGHPSPDGIGRTFERVAP